MTDGLHHQLLLRLRHHGRRVQPRPRRLLADREALDHLRGPLAGLGVGARRAAPASGAGAGAGALGDDRLHRRLPRHPAVAGAPPAVGLPLRRAERGRDPERARAPDLVRRDLAVLVGRDGPDDHLRRVHGRGLPRRNRGRSARADGGGAFARHEPRAVDALRDRPPGRAQGDPAAAERLHRPDEGHVPGRDPRRARGGPGRVRRPDRADQRLGADARRADVPRDHDPARPPGRLADRQPAAQDRARRRALGRRAGRRRASAGPPAVGWPGLRIAPVDGRRAETRPDRASHRPRRRVDAAARGRPQALRRPARPARRQPRGRPGPGRLRDRPERLGEVHAAALHQPARAARRGQDPARGQGDHRQDDRRRPQLRPPAGGDGLPAVQPLPAQAGARERLAGSREGARALRGRGAREGRGAAHPSRPRGQGRTSTPSASRAGSSSGWRSRGRWRWTRT